MYTIPSYQLIKTWRTSSCRLALGARQQEKRKAPL